MGSVFKRKTALRGGLDHLGSTGTPVRRDGGHLPGELKLPGPGHSCCGRLKGAWGRVSETPAAHGCGRGNRTEDAGTGVPSAATEGKAVTQGSASPTPHCACPTPQSQISAVSLEPGL